MRAEPAVGTIRCEDLTEREVRSQGFQAVAGVDEAGRGSLFGPVVAAAVVLSPLAPLDGLNDSKQLDPQTRARLAGLIRERAAAWSVAEVDAATIDRINIYQASRLAMKRAVEQLRPPADFVLVDAVFLDIALPQRALIKGDARCHAIAAASILAKVDRDLLMERYDSVYPGYGLSQHKGYFTPEHAGALRRLGPTPLHRFSFEPVRACAPSRCSDLLQPSLFSEDENGS